VEDGASLEWFPQETIVYDGAVATLETIVELAPGARFIGAEGICLGLPARGEGFERGSCRQVIEIRRDGRPLFIERGRFDGRGRAIDARWGLGGATVIALLAAAPAPAPPIVDDIRACAAALAGGEAAAVTVLGAGETLVCRYLGASGERARRFVHDVWRRLRPAILGRDAVAPRIWAT
jgi:urease accessory protein